MHLSTLFILLIIIGFFQFTLTFITKIKPGILGFASNIPPEKIIELTNQKRAENGAPPVQYNATLSEAARQKASTMFTFGCWSHTCNNISPWWFFKNVGYDYLYAGENLAKDFGDPNSIVTAWINSPTHRDNLLNAKYKDIGIAVVDGVLNGQETTIVVQLFGTSSKAPSIASGAKQQTVVEQAVQQATVQVETQPASPAPQTQAKTPEVLVVKESTIQPAQEVAQGVRVSAFAITKWFYLLLVGLMIAVLTVDGFIISHKQIVRISGKSFVHLSFFIIILMAILLAYPGKII